MSIIQLLHAQLLKLNFIFFRKKVSFHQISLKRAFQKKKNGKEIQYLQFVDLFFPNVFLVEDLLDLQEEAESLELDFDQHQSKYEVENYYFFS